MLSFGIWILLFLCQSKNSQHICPLCVCTEAAKSKSMSIVLLDKAITSKSGCMITCPVVERLLCICLLCFLRLLASRVMMLFPPFLVVQCQIIESTCLRCPRWFSHQPRKLAKAGLYYLIFNIRHQWCRKVEWFFSNHTATTGWSQSGVPLFLLIYNPVSCPKYMIPSGHLVSHGR